MAIPEGYRLLTSEDVGKVFGVDLDSTVHFDTSVTPYTFKSDTPYTNFLSNYYVSIEGYYENAIRLYTGTDFWSEVYNWYMDSYTFTKNVEITSYNTDYEWNTWFYVKDYVDPYNISLTKPKLTVKCANATMEKDLVVQAKVYDGTVEGGEAGSGSGTTVEPPYTSIITNSGNTSFGCYIPDENGILTERIIATGETITIKHYGLFAWDRNGKWSSSWGGQTYAPDTYGTYYCIQTDSTENVYTLSVSPSASSGGAGA